MPRDPDSRKTQELVATVRDVAEVRGEVETLRQSVRDMAAEVEALHRQLAAVRVEMQQGAGTTVIGAGGMTAVVTVRVVPERGD